MKSDFELINDLNPISYIKNYITTGKGNLSFSKICDAVISLLFKEVKKNNPINNKIIDEYFKHLFIFIKSPIISEELNQVPPSILV